jgi:hypothetical protein
LIVRSGYAVAVVVACSGSIVACTRVVVACGSLVVAVVGLDTVAQ